MDFIFFFWTPFVVIQLIYTLLFYRLEKDQLRQLKAKALVKSNGIYFDLIMASLMNPAIALLISALEYNIFQHPPATEAPLFFLLTSVIANTLTFLTVNYLIIKPFSGLYFCDNKIIRIKYDPLLQPKEKEIIEIDNLQYLKILHAGRVTILQLLTKNNVGLDNRYFNGHYLNSSRIEKFCLKKDIKFKRSFIDDVIAMGLLKYID